MVRTFLLGIEFILRATFFLFFFGNFSAKVFETQCESLAPSHITATVSSAAFWCFLTLASSIKLIGIDSFCSPFVFSAVTLWTFSTFALEFLAGQMVGLWAELIFPPMHG